jgi:hypothetical protein
LKYREMRTGEELCRRCAVLQKRNENPLGNDRSGGEVYCFTEMGNAVKGNGRLAGRVLVMAYKADGAIVVACRVLMMMERRNKGGDKEKQYEDAGKAFGPAHVVPSEYEPSIRRAADFVKKKMGVFPLIGHLRASHVIYPPCLNLFEK